ncbi:MAG: hypothetical protein LBF40_08070, partial [Deltaproteobacteria bacterium]|nr:hypothetical protein [Deltaproteobacteria bacterium]
MNSEQESLPGLLNKASTELLLLSPENLVEVSRLLGLVDDIGYEFFAYGSEWPPKVSNALKGILKAVIRDEVPDRAEALETVGEGLGQLEEMHRSMESGAPFMGDLVGFFRKAAKFAEIDPNYLEDPPPRNLLPGAAADEGPAEGGDLEPRGGGFAPAPESPTESDEPDIDKGWWDEAPEGPSRADSDLEPGVGDGPAAAAAESSSDSPTGPAPEGADAGAGPIGPAEADGGQDPPAQDALEDAGQGQAAGGEAWVTPPLEDRELWPHSHSEIRFRDLNLTTEYFQKALISALESLQMRLVTVEQKQDPVSAISETIPSFKTVLGGVSLLDLDVLTRLTADTIGLVDYVSNEQVPHSTLITDILLQACSFLIQGLKSLRMADDGDSWGVFPDWDPEEFRRLQENLWAARQGILTVAPQPQRPASAGASFAAKPKKLGEILVEKGLISEGDLGGLIQAQKTARNVRLGEILIQDGFITQEELDEALRRQQGEDKGRRIGEILVTMGRVDHEHVDKALKIQEGLKETKLGEILLKKKIGAPEKVAAALREQKLSEGQAATTATGSQMVKVETHKLDGLIDLVGELVITQSLVTSNEAVKRLKEQKFNKDLAQVSRITSELQRNAMSLRMVQINNTFRRMNRLVRDLAHKFEKDVDFVSIGEDTEIDRGMVEAIYDPLVHMIRNALDHGLESPKERIAMGKSPKGQVTLKAYHQGGNVVIELSDNGRGLDTEKVIRKAEEKGLIQPGENLSVQQIHNLVFQPGFSTVDKITEISGRGVGMDVVRKSIDALRGKVDFTSVPGEGSNFTIRLPLTLAII